MRYYIIAGEASGDLHGSNLIRELLNNAPSSKIRCWGGEKMESNGGELVMHYRDLAFMGFVEVVKNLPAIFRNIAFCKKDILSFQPDALILIDYPGFNLRIAKWAKTVGLKVIYYISPQVWAWKENRVKLIRKCVDKMLVILPFEKAFYKKWDFEVEYVGHPLVEVINNFKPKTTGTLSPKIIALLPGSRKQEILQKLPVMLQVTRNFPDYLFKVAKAPGIQDQFYENILLGYNNVETITNETYQLLSEATAALVTSGTATLETALFKVPEIVCYKGNAISYQIAKRLIKIKYISLVNLIMDKEVVRELIQDDLTVENLNLELEQILNNPQKREHMLLDYDNLMNQLSLGGNASENAAKIIIHYLSNTLG